MENLLLIVVVIALVVALALLRTICIKRASTKMAKKIALYSDKDLLAVYDFYKSSQELSAFQGEPLWQGMFVLLEQEKERRML